MAAIGPVSSWDSPFLLILGVSFPSKQWTPLISKYSHVNGQNKQICQLARLSSLLDLPFILKNGISLLRKATLTDGAMEKERSPRNFDLLYSKREAMLYDWRVWHPHLPVMWSEFASMTSPFASDVGEFGVLKSNDCNHTSSYIWIAQLCLDYPFDRRCLHSEKRKECRGCRKWLPTDWPAWYEYWHIR